MQSRTDQTLLLILTEALRRVSGCELRVLDSLPATESGPPAWMPSLRVEVLPEPGSSARVLVLKELPALFPKQAHQHALCIQDWLSRQEPPGSYGVLVAPFISAASRDVLLARNVGSMDRAGNIQLHVGGLHVDREVPGNPGRVERELRSAFSPKAAQLLRVALNGPLRPWLGTEWAMAAGVSLGHASQVRSFLVEQQWAVSSRQGVEVIRPEELLKAWRVARATDVQAHSAYTVLHGKGLDEALRRLASMPAGHILLAGASAAHRLAPYLRAPGLTLLGDAEGLQHARAGLGLTPADRGGNVQLLETSESGYFKAALDCGTGLRATDLVTTYLTLWRMGERGQEAAEHLLRERLQPLWRQVTPQRETALETG